jgi:hypothetical protein
MLPTAAVQLLLGPVSGLLHRIGHGGHTVVRNAGGALGGQLAAAIIVSSAHADAPAASGYIGALILCGVATCAGALVACATPRKNRR